MSATALEPLPTRPRDTDVSDGPQWTPPSTAAFLEHLLKVMRRWVEEADAQQGRAVGGGAWTTRRSA